MLRLFQAFSDVTPDIDEYLVRVFPLENFSAFGLELDGVYFPTGEHAFQALKFDDLIIREEIRCCRDPYSARAMAAAFRDRRKLDWADVKYDCLAKVFRAKFDQNPMVAEAFARNRRRYHLRVLPR